MNSKITSKTKKICCDCDEYFVIANICRISINPEMWICLECNYKKVMAEYDEDYESANCEICCENYLLDKLEIKNDKFYCLSCLNLEEKELEETPYMNEDMGECPKCDCPVKRKDLAWRIGYYLDICAKCDDDEVLNCCCRCECFVPENLDCGYCNLCSDAVRKELEESECEAT